MRKEFDIKKKTQDQIIQTIQEWCKQKKSTIPSKEQLTNFLEELKEHPYATKRKYPTVWKAYKESAYETSLPKDQRAVRNNKIIDITLSVLSHPSTTALQMTPGGFDEQRKVGYMVEAYKQGKGTWGQLEKMSINQLKDLCYTSKNLNFFDTQMQFYKQNSAAGSILAIFAVAKVAHAIFQTRHIEIDVKKAMGIKQKGGFSIQLGNSNLTPMMRLDATFNDNGQYIGKVLGEMVASSADAVKDPVLNLMNINVETVNILNSLIRLGIPFKTAAMFLSSKAISNALNDYYKESLTQNISFTQVVKNKLKDLHQENNISWIYEGLTNEELLDAIKGGDPKLDIKVLQMFLGISNLASSVQKASFITRFNSMSSAVGPLVIDNLITEMKLHDFPLETIYLKKNGELVDQSALSMLDEFPILNAFKQTLTLSNAIFGEDIITNSKGFRRMIASLSGTALKTLMSDRNAFCKLGDFYKSAMLIYSGVFNSEDLKYYIHDFPKEFIVQNFKEKFPENEFVQLLKYNVEKGSERLSLGMELTGMDKRDQDRITAAWLDLYKSNEEGKKLAIDLVKYFFFKGGIGFSPKTPLHLLPVQLRQVIPGYMDAFGKKRVLLHETLVYQQFVQNYWQNNKIAPIRKVKLHDEGDDLFSTGDIPMHLEGTYFKMKNSEGQFDLYYVVAATKDYANVVKIPKLGNNGEYIEINQQDLQPMESTISNDLEIEDETEIIEVGATSPQLQEEEPIEVQDDAISVKEKLETLLNDVQKERVSQLKDMSKEEQHSRKNATLAWMKRIFKQHGIEVSEQNLEKTFEEYCS